jgi:hypothetical protein
LPDVIRAVMLFCSVPARGNGVTVVTALSRCGWASLKFTNVNEGMGNGG